MEALIQELINQQKKTNELLMYGYQGKNPNELLTIDQVAEETGIGKGKVQKMFQDQKLQAQRYTTPFVVTRQALNEYLKESHDYLKC